MICGKCYVVYYMIGGMLPEVVRDGGTIPLDFDIVIGMLQKEHKSFKTMGLDEQMIRVDLFKKLRML